jgi:hypothetical protein
MKMPLYPRLYAVLGCAALAGCGSQAGTDYHGDPMLTLKGSVVIENEHAPKELVPTIVFYTDGERDRDGMYFMDTEVSGTFPANFTLSLLHPAPAEAIVEMKDEREASRGAFGFITAVPPNHQPFVRLAGDPESQWLTIAIGTDLVHPLEMH